MTHPLILADPLPPMFLEMLGPDLEIRPLNGTHDEATRSRVAGIVTYAHPNVDGSVMDEFPNLKVISNHGVGVDHIDVEAATIRGIPVGNTPGCLDDSTADMTMALLLAIARNVVIGDAFARGPEFTVYDPSILIGQEVTGSRLGIVGLGRIGIQVARRAQAFDMEIVYHNRNRRPDVETELGVQWLELDELLSSCDFVALNCPLTPETTGLIGAREFALMRDSAILINMARGPVVDTDALYLALTEHQIAAAAIDVTDPEPLPRNHPLLHVSNLIITPHLGSASNRTRRRMIEMSVENLQAGLAGDPLPYQVVR